MNPDDINKIIDTLTTKLGPASKVVWEAYLRQQFVIGIQQAVIGTILLLMATVCAIIGIQSVKALMNHSGDEGDNFAIIVICLIAGLTAFILSILLVSDAFGHFVNPQYGAIQALLGR